MYARRPGRELLRLGGDQALWFLDQLVSNQVEHLPAGETAEALLLTPTGRITKVMRITNVDGDVLLDAGPPGGKPVAEFFNGRLFTTRVTIDDAGDEFEIVRLFGENAPPSGQIGAQVLVPRAFDVWVPVAAMGDSMTELDSSGVRAASTEEILEIEVAEGAAEFGTDFDATFLPQEAAAERMVHFKKGCYLGQEAVAMAQRGRVKRRLRHLRFEPGAVMSTGAVRFDGSEVGTVTRSAAGFGIATLSTSVGLGQEVLVGDASVAHVEELPGTHEGPKPPSARELRERLQGSR